MTAPIAPLVLAPAPSLVAAVLGLLVLVLAVVALRRRGREAEDPSTGRQGAEDVTEDVTEDEPADDGEPQVGADSDDDPADDPRALRLLVRTLEAAIEELGADLQRVTNDNTTLASAVERPPAVDPVEEPDRVEAETDRRARLIREALRGAAGDDLPARLNAALVRQGAERAFARPALAACLGADLPTVRPEAVVAIPGADAGAPAAAAPTSADRVTAHESEAPEDAEAVVANPSVPSGPERVLPVPAPPAPVSAPKRGLFRRPVA